MTTTNTVDAARVELLLNELRLPSMRLRWVKLAEQSDKEGWPAARFLATLVEHEVADRSCRRMERHLAEARLPAGKTLATFDFEAVPMVSKAQVMALASGDAWLKKGANILLFGPPGGGKSHLSAALGLALVENGWRVLFTRTTDLVQRLQLARRDLTLENAISNVASAQSVFNDSSLVAAHRSHARSSTGLAPYVSHRRGVPDPAPCSDRFPKPLVRPRASPRLPHPRPTAGGNGRGGVHHTKL